jgi:hypothetical protein
MTAKEQLLQEIEKRDVVCIGHKTSKPTLSQYPEADIPVKIALPLVEIGVRWVNKLRGNNWMGWQQRSPAA